MVSVSEDSFFSFFLEDCICTGSTGRCCCRVYIGSFGGFEVLRGGGGTMRNFC